MKKVWFLFFCLGIFVTVRAQYKVRFILKENTAIHHDSMYVEKQYNAEEVPDRIVTITRDTVFTDSVVCWRDEVITDKKIALTSEQADSNKVSIMTAVANMYAFYPEFYNADSAFFYAQEALRIQEKMKATVQSKQQSQSSFNYQLMSLQEVISSANPGDSRHWGIFQNHWSYVLKI